MSYSCTSIPAIYLLFIIGILLLILYANTTTPITETFTNTAEPTNNFFMPQLVGGLGNNLFQLCAALGFAKARGRQLAINLKHMENSQHANNKSYFNTIFKNFQPLLTDREPLVTISENEISTLDTKASNNTVLLTGYYQDYKYLNPGLAVNLISVPFCPPSGSL